MGPYRLHQRVSDKCASDIQNHSREGFDVVLSITAGQPKALSLSAAAPTHFAGLVTEEIPVARVTPPVSGVIVIVRVADNVPPGIYPMGIWATQADLPGVGNFEIGIDYLLVVG